MAPKKFVYVLLALALLGSTTFSAKTDGKRGRARHVVLIVWDGMRPDFVTEKLTPNLWKLAQSGATFRNHHSIYPSLTNVNGTVLATGVYPGRNGLVGNNEFRPELNPKGPIDTAVADNIRRGDELSEGKYLAAPTIPELVQASGQRSAVAGTKWVANLFDRGRNRTSEAAQKSRAVTAGAVVPVAAQAALTDSLGSFPEKQFPNLPEDQWTTAALIDAFWKEGVPAFSLLWLSDPDFTAHDSAPGSPNVLAATQNSDALLGKVIEALEAKKVRYATDIFVVSDHGFSTVERAVDIPALLQAEGFKAVKKFEGEPETGSVLVVGNGGTVFFYVIGRDEAVTLRLVEWLQQSDFAGVIFSRRKIEGTFSLAEAKLDKEDGPDVVMSFRWNEKPNQFGTAGMIMADWNRPAGKGTHATLSRFDLHNTLIAAGPDFRRGYQSELPSGNIDLAPTILRVLGIAPKFPLDGRVLSEAMTSRSENDIPKSETETIEASRGFPAGEWRQTLKISTVGEQRYLDEGNAAFTPTPR